MTRSADNTPWSQPVPSGSIDPMLQARLDRLAQRQAPTAPAGPPRVGPAQTSRTANLPKAKRRHAAKGSRAAALAISLAATGGLSALFAFNNGSTAIATAGGLGIDLGGSSAAASATASTTDAAAAGPAAAAGTSVAAGTAAAGTVAAGTTTNSAASTAGAATTAAAAKTPATATATTAAAAKTTATTSATTAAAAKTTATTSAAASASGLANGQYTGTSISTRWGPVQVAITVAGGKITDVKTVDVPMDRQKSVQINTAATPILRSESLTAQSASINNVSGATYTSTGYASSLQSAIDQARTGSASVSA